MTIHIVRPVRRTELTEPVTFRLAESKYRALEALAERYGISKAELVKQLVLQGMELIETTNPETELE